ncbi:Uncharacterised protein [Bordetella ansorpii]|uniref:Preprotein translocase subunit SecD n=1 Tax=Bordetella ansorpii TaxID=288768 RepID=A0A157S7R7_9BORD|nr:hypothetical protein [Bordetella ansorpii]SAI66439.1 Uncharacterised protein [Bordetella ansorpii]
MRAEDLLPDHANHVERDGVAIRKGSVGAFLINARAWSDPGTSATDRKAAQRDILEALPALRALGLFDVLSIADPALRRLVDEQEKQQS